MRCALLAWLALSGCSFTPGSIRARDDAATDDVLDPDGMPDAIPDAAPCASVGVTECTGDTLRTCTTAGQAPDERPCAWGCDSSGTARCFELAPSGGWEMASTGDTTDFTGLALVTLPDGAVVNTATGAISGAGAAGSFRTGVVGTNAGIDHQLRAIGSTGRFVAIFRARHFTISNLTFTGTNAVAFIADEGIDLSGLVNALGPCSFGNPTTPGPGGFFGGANGLPGLPLPPGGGGVSGGNGNDFGGGGGGHGGAGGDGGNVALSGGAVRGDVAIALLLGGSGGGGGDDHSNAGRGGGGGAAIHLLANGPIVMTAGGVNAGGCGGRAGTNTNDGGGGGGAGGAILIEAPTVSLTGTLAANGGGGGGGNTGANTIGDPGQLSRAQAMGGPAGAGSAGGLGAAGSITKGGDGTSANGGGAGGGIGRIRINTRGGAATITNAVLSPGPGDPGPTYTEAPAATR